jgi:hypothetical protein
VTEIQCFKDQKVRLKFLRNQFFLPCLNFSFYSGKRYKSDFSLILCSLQCNRFKIESRSIRKLKSIFCAHCCHNCTFCLICKKIPTFWLLQKWFFCFFIAYANNGIKYVDGWMMSLCCACQWGWKIRNFFVFQLSENRKFPEMKRELEK